MFVEYINGIYSALNISTDTINIIARIIGFIGILSTVIGFQCKKHKYVIGFRTANELLFAFQYFLLGGFTGAALNVIGSIRNIIFIECVKRNKSTMIWRIIFSAFFIVFSIITFGGFPTVIFCIGKLTTTYVYGSKNMTFVRIMAIVTSVMWITYNACIGSYEAIVSDSLTIISAFVGIIRIDIIERKKLKNAENSIDD